MQSVIGIDVGSVAVGIVTIDGEHRITGTAYAPHRGHIAETLISLLDGFDLSAVCGVGVTASTPRLITTGHWYDGRICFIEAARRRHGDVGSLLIVGAERFGLVLFDEEGRYLNYRANTSCAAGTGSFLDQQAGRLNLPGIAEFSEIAFANQGGVPKIASRCAVFAKTDLIHAQQEGYSLAEICDGLCSGLARNIADTLFGGITLKGPLVFAGGVSRNRAVVKHLTALAGIAATTDEHSHLYGAYGAALHWLEDHGMQEPLGLRLPADLVREDAREKSYYYEPLALRKSVYPDFAGRERIERPSRRHPHTAPVEVDVYEDLSSRRSHEVSLGIDIGSTSTKAVIVDGEHRVLAGLYTRTAGRPVEAMQTILEALDDLQREYATSFMINSAGTTGSGRKFIAEIIGADCALDEITAHARAAGEIDAAVDTIIEIGGQDAKFTTLRDGRVTFSVMNNVCAAGTGSFIEEQARKLGVGLAEYSRRAERPRAPLSSDRCTVFMERDLNNFLSEGYQVDEILASVLHSVRDNYLTKVAVEANIGERVFFQGATAKNRALVAAFEQRLGKPILVSRFCHLTGAMGAALHLIDEPPASTRFRGLALYHQEIPVHTEVCDLCTNHCKIKVAEVNGETVAFGFLCGRDYETERYVRRDGHVDLLADRRLILAAGDDEAPRVPGIPGITVGIPAALHLFEDLPLWSRFFANLGIATVTSEACRGAIALGKNVTGAEFCAPLSALHGHVQYLRERADVVFLPTYMEHRQKDRAIRRTYCYYTQYAPAIASLAMESGYRERILSPVIHTLYGSFYLKTQLYRMVKDLSRRAGGGRISFSQVSGAYDRALTWFAAYHDRLRDSYRREAAAGDDVSVVLLGRPYTVLSRTMNSGIPELFARQGVKAFYQDVLEPAADRAAPHPVLAALHWHYGATILDAAEAMADAPGVYPVLITSFKCTPDAYTVDYFKRIMDARGKPYLVLQLDEHDSSVGYETRIEAAIRSFRNHRERAGRPLAVASSAPGEILTGMSALAGKTLLMPRWDAVSCQLLVAVLRREGIDARLMEETDEVIRKSMRLNTGQCIPLTIIAQNALEYVRSHGLDPASTTVWSLNSKIACNIGMFPTYTRDLLVAMGPEMAGITVYNGDITFMDFPVRIAVNAYIAYMFGGMLRKIGCYLRPYEREKGATDRAMAGALAIVDEALQAGASKEAALDRAIDLFAKVAVDRVPRPRVALFGDVYARDNDVMNQDLIRVIEENGGEVVTTPYNEYMRIVADPYINKWFKQGLVAEAALARVLQHLVPLLDNRYYPYFERILGPRIPIPKRDYRELLTRFSLTPHHSGESMENVLKILHLAEQYDDLALLVQTNPSYCCPSLVSEAMADRIEEITGVPVVTIEYDGTIASRNENVIPYLRYPRQGRKATARVSADR